MNNNGRMILNKINKINAIPCFPMPKSELARLPAKGNKENERIALGDAFRHPLKFAPVYFSVLADWQSQFFTLSDNAYQSKKRSLSVQTFGLDKGLVFLCRQIVKYLSWIIIHPILKFLYIVVSKSADMRTFWNPPTYKLVGIFITATFTGVIRVAVIYFCPFHHFVIDTFFYCLHV